MIKETMKKRDTLNFYDLNRYDLEVSYILKKLQSGFDSNIENLHHRLLEIEEIVGQSFINLRIKKLGLKLVSSFE